MRGSEGRDCVALLQHSHTSPLPCSHSLPCDHICMHVGMQRTAGVLHSGPPVLFVHTSICTYCRARTWARWWSRWDLTPTVHKGGPASLPGVSGHEDGTGHAPEAGNSTPFPPE
jgi:hypothetical protein